MYKARFGNKKTKTKINKINAILIPRIRISGKNGRPLLSLVMIS